MDDSRFRSGGTTVAINVADSRNVVAANERIFNFDSEELLWTILNRACCNS